LGVYTESVPTHANEDLGELSDSPSELGDLIENEMKDCKRTGAMHFAGKRDGRSCKNNLDAQEYDLQAALRDYERDDGSPLTVKSMTPEPPQPGIDISKNARSEETGKMKSKISKG
jgi:hypothetical protein